MQQRPFIRVLVRAESQAESPFIPIIRGNCRRARTSQNDDVSDPIDKEPPRVAPR